MNAKRLEKALEAAKSVAEVLPPPARKTKRGRKIIVYLTEDEHRRLERFARERAEPLAVATRYLALAALETLGR